MDQEKVRPADVWAGLRMVEGRAGETAPVIRPVPVARNSKGAAYAALTGAGAATRPSSSSRSGLTILPGNADNTVTVSMIE